MENRRCPGSHSRSLTKCQFVAFGAGVLLCGVILLVAVLGASPRNEWIAQHFGDLSSFVIIQALFFFLAAGFAFVVARYAGRHDKVAFITCAVPALAFFLMGYLLDINTSIESSARHAMTGGCVGFVPPLHVIGQLIKMFFPSIWAALAGVAGLSLHRLARKRGVVIESDPVVEVGHAFRWFVLALGVGVVASLIGYASYVGAKNTPEARASQVEKILANPKSSEMEKTHALWDLWSLQDDASTPIFQDVVKSQPAPLNVLAAAFLVNRNDLTGLPLLEANLMKSPEWIPGVGQINMGLMLEGIRNPQAIPVLVKLMKSPDSRIRSGAVQALWNTKSKDAIEALIGGLYDESWQVRWISTLGIGRDCRAWKGSTGLGASARCFQE
jgi:hypothetical protein